MAQFYYAWWEATDRFFQIKFVATLDTSTLIDANFVLYDTAATPAVVPGVFETIEIEKNFSSVSRIFDLWWETPPETGAYTLHVNNLKSFLGEDVGDFTIDFDWVLDSATPVSGSVEELLEPSRDPVEVEDYSIKTPSWTIVEDTEESATPSSLYLEVLDIAPGVSSHHNLSVQENLGKIDILFTEPVYSNYITPYYFSVTSKPVQKGIALWENVAVSVIGSTDSKIVSVYLPAVDADGNTVYSYGQTLEDIEGLEFFIPQTKYRLVISSAVGG
jgi:hypothetical protein